MNKVERFVCPISNVRSVVLILLLFLFSIGRQLCLTKSDGLPVATNSINGCALSHSTLELGNLNQLVTSLQLSYVPSN